MTLIKSTSLALGALLVSSVAFAAAGQACKYSMNMSVGYGLTNNLTQVSNMAFDATSVTAPTFKESKRTLNRTLDGITTGLGFGYYFTDSLHFGLDFGYNPKFTAKTVNMLPVAAASVLPSNVTHNLRTYSGVVSATYEFVGASNMTPFVTAGLGWEQVQYKIKNTGVPAATAVATVYNSALAGTQVTDFIKSNNASGFRGQVGAGVAWQMGSTSLEFAYKIANLNSVKFPASIYESDNTAAATAGTNSYTHQNLATKRTYQHNLSLAVKFVI